ncbi:IS630 family transposase [endosymbiont DhMRE of Dentiscutata heterogama]|uniref:IS630 family transposase n=1 Tax=endosymbiont DhMRE of Dentiscutata heterogama TaxID=1609546 RepID=UPI002AD42C7D|nr:IS630 family transposase [endosymbiont DhMRE of Dentiscutata heterogama]
MIQEYNLRTEQITKLREKKASWKWIADFYQVSERTAYRWNKLGESIKLTESKVGCKPKINEIVLPLLHDYIEKHNTKTQHDMLDYLFQETGLKVNQSTISRTLKKHNITYKKAEKQYSEQDKEKVRQFVIDNFCLLSSSSFYALDESGFNLGAVPGYAYAPKNQRAVVKRPGKRGENYTLLLCVRNVNSNAAISWKMIKGGAKSADFHHFLSSVEFPADEKKYLLLDNARIHHATDSCKKVKLSTIAELAKKKNIELKYLPGYAPKLNPVENCFSVIKSYYRQQRPRSEKELIKVIEEAIKELQKHDLTKYFKSCFRTDI